MTTPSVLDPAGPVGLAERTILLDSLAIMLAIVVPVIIATIGFAWWFRKGNTRAFYWPHWAHSGAIELVVWSIPALVVIVVGGIGWISSHRLDPAQPIDSKVPPLEVDVVSLDWKWLFFYPKQGIASVNTLVVPAGVPIHFRLTSASVMNSFFVPRLGSMIYTMNGMVDDLNLQADRPGYYLGESTMISGDGFPDMHFIVHAVPPAQFAAWAAATGKAGDPVLDSASYALLARQGVPQRPFTYRAVAPHLFDAIVTRRLPPGPGPSLGRGGPDTSPRSGIPGDAR